MNERAWGSIAVAALMSACGAAPPPGNGNDSGVTIAPDTGAACANHIPTGAPGEPQFGTLVGRSFAEFPAPLSDCNGGQHTFYGGDYCDSNVQFTVISIAAGWCHPCQMESDLLMENVVHAYGPHGVRVIQLLVQDPNYQMPNGAFCNQWVTTHGLSVTGAVGVGNVELLDPAQVTNAYFPDGALPSTLVVDSHGVIRFHEDGASESLASLTNELDSLLGL